MERWLLEAAFSEAFCSGFVIQPNKEALQHTHHLFLLVVAVLVLAVSCRCGVRHVRAKVCLHLGNVPRGTK